MNDILQQLESKRKDDYISRLLKKEFEYYPIASTRYSPNGKANECEQNSLNCALSSPKLLSFEEWTSEGLESFGGRKSWLSDLIINQVKYQDYVDKFKRRYDLMYGYMVLSSGDLVHHWMVYDNEKNELVEVTPLRRNFLGYLMKKMNYSAWEKAKNYWDVKEGKFGFSE